MSVCTYDNPATMRRECWENGKLVCAYTVANNNLEGIVWHHPDGRWAKIKRRDFGLKW